MDREEATKALAVLRTVVGQARDDTALQNWGVIWILHAFTNAAGFIATNVMLWHGVNERWPFAAMWLGVVTVNIGSIFLLKARRAGAKTFIENQIWAIWLAFIGAVVLLAVVNDLMGQHLFFLAPVIAILSAVGFASMGAVMGHRWYIATAIFAAASLGMAAARDYQFVILGVVWGLAQLAGGVWLILDKRRRIALGGDRVRLV